MGACVDNWFARPIRRSSLGRTITLAGVLVKGCAIAHEWCTGRTAMNASSRHIALVVGLIVVGTVCACSVPAAAENKKITIAAKKPPGDIARTVVTPGDVPNHEVAQYVASYEITSPEPDFNGFKTLNYSQSDSVAGTGTHRGYAMWPLKNGDTVYIKYEGTHKTITKDGGAWESSF